MTVTPNPPPTLDGLLPVDIPPEHWSPELEAAFAEVGDAWASGDSERLRKAIVDLIGVFMAFVVKLKADSPELFESITDSQLEAQLNELEKLREEIRALANKKSFWSKLLDVFSIIVSVAAVLIAPSPMTIAMLIVTLVMTLEPMLADVVGYESVVGKAMAGLTGWIQELDISDAAKAVLTAVVIIAVVVAAVLLVRGGLSMMKPPPMPQALQNFQAWLKAPAVEGGKAWGNANRVVNHVEFGVSQAANAYKVVPAYFEWKADGFAAEAYGIGALVLFLEGNKEILAQIFEQWEGMEELFHAALEIVKHQFAS